MNVWTQLVMCWVSVERWKLPISWLEAISIFNSSLSHLVRKLYSKNGWLLLFLSITPPDLDETSYMGSLETLDQYAICWAASKCTVLVLRQMSQIGSNEASNDRTQCAELVHASFNLVGSVGWLVGAIYRLNSRFFDFNLMALCYASCNMYDLTWI